MRYQEYEPEGSLHHIIRCVWTLTGEDAVPSGPEPVIPDGCAELVFNLGDPITQLRNGTATLDPRQLCVGQTTGPTALSLGQRTRIVGLRLWPWAARTIIGVPMRELQDEFVAIDLVNPTLANLCDRLAERTEAEWPTAVCDYFRSRVELDPDEVRARAIIAHIRSHDGNTSSKMIADQLGVCRRTVERVMHDAVGLAPSLFGRILRVQRALRLIRSHRNPKLSAIAVQSGYYDQAHFTRHVRRFTGLTPSAFIARERRLTDAFLESTPL